MNLAKELSVQPKSNQGRNVFQITKNSGEKVLFAENKLKNSIVAALRSVGIEDNPISNQLVDEVMQRLGEELNYQDGISTLDIREAVEIAFLERGLTQAAQQYHDFNDSSDISDQAGEALEVFTEPAAANMSAQPAEPEAELAEILEVEDLIEPPHIEDNHQSELYHQPNVSLKDKLKLPDKLPADRQSITHKFSLAQSSGYLIVSLYNDGRPGEIIIHFTATDLSPAEQQILELFIHMLSAGLSWQVDIKDLLPTSLGPGLKNIFSEKDDQFSHIWEIIAYVVKWFQDRFNE